MENPEKDEEERLETVLHDGLGTTSIIGDTLRALYDRVATENVPDRFFTLLDELETAEQKVLQPEVDQPRHSD